MQQRGEQTQECQNTDLSPTSPTTVDYSEITQRIGDLKFHKGLATLDNMLCNVCLEQFPSIDTDTAGVRYSPVTTSQTHTLPRISTRGYTQKAAVCHA